MIKGIKYESAVENWLKSKGNAIIARNFRTRHGEIDIIAADDEYIMFIEVKAKKSDDFGAPREVVDLRKQQKICKTAAIYLAENLHDLQPRFDVAEVYINHENDVISRINYIKNAFDFIELGANF